MALIKKYLGEGKIPSNYKKTKYCPKCGDGDSTVVLEDYVLPHDKSIKIENVKKRICGDLSCGYEWMHPKHELMIEKIIEAKGYFPKIGQLVPCKNCDQDYEYFDPYLSDTKNYKLGASKQIMTPYTALKKKIGRKLRNGIYYDSPRILFIKEGNCPKCLGDIRKVKTFFLYLFLFILIVPYFF